MKVYIYIYNFNKMTATLSLTALELFISITNFKHDRHPGVHKKRNKSTDIYNSSTFTVIFVQVNGCEHFGAKQRFRFVTAGEH
jgi:hypothetical protein